MGRRRMRIGVSAATILVGALASGPAPAGADTAVRTCDVPTVVHRRTLTTGPQDPAPPGTPLPLGADLDFDGRPDLLVASLGPDAGGSGRSAVLLSTVPEPIALPPADGVGRTYEAVEATREGTRTHLVATVAGRAATKELFELRSTCARSWLGRASRWVLGAQPSDDAALGSLDPTAPLTRSQRRTLAGALVRSPAARTALVDQRFQAALHRDAGPESITRWVDALRSGRRSPEDLTAALFGSAEFLASHGGTLDGWATGLYRQGTGQAVDPAGAAYWMDVARREGRERAAAQFFATPAARRALVASIYPGELVLDRPADPSGLERGVQLLGTGGWDALQVELLSSDEFYLAAQSSNRLRPL